MPNIFSQDLKPVVEQKVMFYDFGTTAKKSRYKKLSELSIVRSDFGARVGGGMEPIGVPSSSDVYPVLSKLEICPHTRAFSQSRFRYLLKISRIKAILPFSKGLCSLVNGGYVIWQKRNT
jgi:hypothetical protein